MTAPATTTLISDLIGKRVLLTVKAGFSQGAVDEYRVLEVSPAGQWVKLQGIHGNKFWRPVSGIALVEVLKPLTTEPVPL